MNPAVFGIYGKSGSGKTTLIIKIIKSFTKEGFKIACIKITDKKINLDVKQKDTWKYAKAGAKLVVLSSVKESDFLLKNKLEIQEIVEKINNINNCDLIIIEGANDNFTKKIRIGNIKQRKHTILTYKGDFEELISIIKKEIIKRENMARISIKVNGKQIQLTDFPADFIKNTITGMLKSLKGVKKIKKVEINIEM
ncbi:MAG: molybdopterin-guanine dinucleotide biosynthesis protein B [Thermoplasmatota archaeon]|jgi:molybdopterin-guanine dinucleotide biosynthesis protein MobB